MALRQAIAIASPFSAARPSLFNLTAVRCSHVKERPLRPASSSNKPTIAKGMPWENIMRAATNSLVMVKRMSTAAFAKALSWALRSIACTFAHARIVSPLTKPPHSSAARTTTKSYSQ